MTSLFLTLIQFVFILLLAPLSFGVVKKCKAFFQGRKGASIFLQYYALLTLMKKEMVISKSTSWVFRFVPYLVLTLSMFAVLVLLAV